MITPPPLRILLAIGVYEPDHGGAAEWLRQYAAWLVSRGHTVTILCERADAAAPAGCALLTLPPGLHTKNSWARAGALQNLIRRANYGLVYDTGCLRRSDVFHPLMGSLIHNWLRQLCAYPLPLRLRRFCHVRFWRDVRLQLHHRRQHRVLIAASRLVANDFARLGCPQSEIVPNGIAPLEAPNPTKILALRESLQAREKILVLMTATNFHLKGVMTAVRALAQLPPEKREQIRLIITGQAPDRQFHEFITQHQLQTCCHHVGWVPSIDEYYHAADIFLHPAYHDACSLSTLKALTAGCATVTSRFDGASEFITDRVNGLVLQDPANPTETARALVALLEPAFRNRLRSATAAVKPQLAQKHQFQKLEDICVKHFAPRTSVA